eukprot:TRINITY_DN20347_c0_g1_i1.p1 TRINITY_DN20347_c0_g1~~TRINITY_DN20347_c0_g1_i1.p1  ORF type:complete len:250 (+),score=39.10 TRINITY_DN20347_c0_g1_i1:96-845(+)
MSVVFVLAGQSNMVGRAKAQTLPTELRSPPKNVQMMYQNDLNFGKPGKSKKWGPLKPQHSPGLNITHFGPEIAIGHGLAKLYPDKKIYFIKFAMGSTNLHTNWNPATTSKDGYYSIFADYVNSNIKTIKDKDVTLGGIFWYQGSSDCSKPKDANAYQANLSTFITAVNKDITLADKAIPIVGGLISSKKCKKRATVNTAMTNVAAEPENCFAIVNTDDLDFLGDAIHLTGPSLCKLGERMVAEFQKLVV